VPDSQKVPEKRRMVFMQVGEFSVAAWMCAVSDTLLSHSAAGKLFQTASPLYAKLCCATDVWICCCGCYYYLYCL